MRIHGKAGAFAAAAKIAASAAGNGSIPILGAALIDAGDRITFSGTDLDLSLRAECAGTVVAAGRAAVPADALSGLLAGLAADAEVAVETVDAGVQVKAGRSRYRLEGLPASEFPPLPAMPASGELTLGRDRVRRLFGALAFTIPTEDTRYYLCGAYLHVADGHLTSVATDGYRLVRSISDIAPASDALPERGVIIPKAVIERIGKLFKADEIRLQIDDSTIAARAGNITLTAKLIDGTFPNYQSLIPAEANASAEIERAPLMAALGRMAVIARTERPTLTLRWNGNGGARLTWAAARSPKTSSPPKPLARPRSDLP
jgi:DNA polymerase-3 subunit beta